MFSCFKSTSVAELSIGGDGFLNIIIAMATAITTTAQAITIPAIAPPDNPLELFL